MSIQLKTKLLNTAGFADELKKLPSEIGRKVLVGATRPGANIVAQEFRLNVPVKTGELKKSIVVKVDNQTVETSALFYIGAGKFYLKFLEFGTDKIPEQRPLGQAFDEKAEEAVETIVKVMRVRLDREFAKMARAKAA